MKLQDVSGGHYWTLASIWYHWRVQYRLFIKEYILLWTCFANVLLLLFWNVDNYLVSCYTEMWVKRNVLYKTSALLERWCVGVLIFPMDSGYWFDKVWMIRKVLVSTWNIVDTWCILNLRTLVYINWEMKKMEVFSSLILVLKVTARAPSIGIMFEPSIFCCLCEWVGGLFHHPSEKYHKHVFVTFASNIYLRSRYSLKSGNLWFSGSNPII